LDGAMADFCIFTTGGEQGMPFPQSFCGGGGHNPSHGAVKKYLILVKQVKTTKVCHVINTEITFSMIVKT
jgi:hypothetical protein